MGRPLLGGVGRLFRAFLLFAQFALALLRFCALIATTANSGFFLARHQELPFLEVERKITR